MNFSTSIKTLLAASVAALVANSAMAADGTINFTGEITAASCNITGGTGTGVTGDRGSQVIDVQMGTVSIDSLNGTQNGGIAAGRTINLNLDCGATGTGLTHVALRFDAISGSGLDANNNELLRTTGTAEGVGIGLFHINGTRINLANSGDVFESELVNGGDEDNPAYTANLALRAAYVASGAIGNVTPGTANGTLPFTLTYR
ncbi:fimbrial protein [Metapseudomonas resinovorans]|uniref:Fimbrial-type adhesion domain-containing protein n=1 Tax=Metapseudomonas resinovorans NBRC 106553 TaxID=1245471 RepID=S6AC71_METRE|nr:fimbrial protein [Pseudomonas resinovorans]BAN46162.1 hypothetical protein PCA10_04300 [Pseudomonas resinovorans NBRC 106553]